MGNSSNDKMDSLIADAGRTETDPRDADVWERDGGRGTYGGYDINLAIEGEKDSSLVYRWATNEGDRINRLMKKGYRPVLQDMTINFKGDVRTDDGNWISKKTGRLDTGAPQVSYLMATKREFYNQDRAAAAKEITASETAIDENELAPHDGKVYHESSLEVQSGTPNPFRQ